LYAGLVQINNFFTRVSKILDLILVAEPLFVSDLSLGAPSGGCDHASLTLLLYPPMPDNLEYNNVVPLSYCDWDSVNWDLYRNYCNNVS